MLFRSVYSVVAANVNGAVTGKVMTLLVDHRIAVPPWNPGSLNWSLAVSTELGRAYWLESRDSLEADQWRFVFGLTNVQGWNNFIDTNAAAPRRFYRIGSAPWP